MFHPYELDFENRINLGACLLALKRCLPPSDVCKVIKTWLMGWVTSYRMHEDPLLSCILGCTGQPDSMHHYVHCPHLFALLRYQLQHSSSDPLERLGLINPNHDCLKIVCCTFSAYHAVKAQIRARAIAAPIKETAVNSSSLRMCWSVFAQTFQAEAGERAIPCRSFSLPQFIRFLASPTDQIEEPLIRSGRGGGIPQQNVLQPSSRSRSINFLWHLMPMHRTLCFITID